MEVTVVKVVIAHPSPSKALSFRFRSVSSTPPANTLIDSGAGGHAAIGTLSPITSFSIQPEDYTNSAVAALIVTWYTSIETQDGDTLWIPFPEGEVAFIGTLSDGSWSKKDNEGDI